ncbi:MAG: hypothetical protein KBB32_01540 [Spirochaetia bacterium]|nr:hypothetical protein [Spirochaetia bacterium]
MKTRQTNDEFTTIKIPESLRRQLRLLAAQKNKFIYQVIAEMAVREIEMLKGNKS